MIPTSSRPTSADVASHLAEAGGGVRHGTVTVTRHLAGPVSRVFAAFSEPSLRMRWFRVPGEPGSVHHELDFRVGGREIAGGVFAPLGVPEAIEYRSQFLDIVADERIVFVHEVILDGRRRSVSLVTVELAADASGTHPTYTEQYSIVAHIGDGATDVAHLEGSLPVLLNGLTSVIEPATGEDER